MSANRKGNNNWTQFTINIQCKSHSKIRVLLECKLLQQVVENGGDSVLLLKIFIVFFKSISNNFNMLMLKIKKISEKIYFNVFLSKKTILKNILHYNLK